MIEGDAQIAIMLVEAGADVNIKDYTSQTAIELAYDQDLADEFDLAGELERRIENRSKNKKTNVDENINVEGMFYIYYIFEA